MSDWEWFLVISTVFWLCWGILSYHWGIRVGKRKIRKKYNFAQGDEKLYSTYLTEDEYLKIDELLSHMFETNRTREVTLH